MRMLFPLICTCAVMLGRATAGADYSIGWYTIDAGGGTTAGASFECSGTAGQADAEPAGAITGGSFELVGGFWGAASGAPPCPGDIDASGEVDFGDLIALLAAWGPCGSCPEDLNNDGTVDFEDLLVVLGAWGACPE